MSGQIVGNSSLVAQFVYFGSGSDAASTTTQITAATLPLIEAEFTGLSGTISPLLPYLKTDLGVLFNNAWSSAGVPSQLQSLFIQQAQQQGVNTSNVSATAPAGGTLWALTESAIPATGSTPERPGQLLLTFNAPGCAISFETPSVAAQAALDIATFGFGTTAHLKDEWTVTFDLQVAISTLVPILPFSLAFTSDVEASNADSKPENTNADLDYVANAFIVWLGEIANDLGISVNNTSVEPTYSQQLEAGIDNTESTIPGGLGIGALANALNGVGWAGNPPNIVSYGFTQCGFSVVPIGSTNALALTLTHPLDPPPVLENVNDPAADMVLSQPPSLSASASQAKPGTPISAVGNNFPVDTTTQLTVKWDNTSSGIPSAGQIRSDGGGVITVPPSNPFFNRYFYTAKSLSPNTVHVFQARCGDGVSYSQWSKPLSIRTSDDDVVKLTLNSLLTTNDVLYSVGSAKLSTASNQWNCSGMIPSNTQPGTYIII